MTDNFILDPEPTVGIGSRNTAENAKQNILAEVLIDTEVF